MADAQHKLSRRAVLAGACAGAAVPLRREGDSYHFPAGDRASGAASDGKWKLSPHGVARWQKALALYARAEAELEALAHSEDDHLYDRALGRHNAALARLLRGAAPDLAAVGRKLDLIVRHQVFELSFAGPCLAALRADVRRLGGESRA